MPDPCDLCPQPLGAFPFECYRPRLRLCPLCAGRLVNPLIAYLRKKQRQLRASFDMADAWAKVIKSDAEAVQVEAQNLTLPLGDPNEKTR